MAAFRAYRAWDQRLHCDRDMLALVNETATSDSQLTDGLTLVRQIAKQLLRCLPQHIELDELIALGNLGLVEARQRFVPRGVPFGAFAARRIRGAMLDGLRKSDVLTRTERARHDPAGPAVRQLVPLHGDVECADDGDAEQALVERGRIDELRAAVARLPSRERSVVERHFVDGMRLKQIGAELGVTEARACQILSRALARLRHGVETANERRPDTAGQNVAHCS
jgi:RNA polymerase sigma factor FliA